MKNRFFLSLISISFIILSACTAPTPIPAAVKTELVATGQALTSPVAATPRPEGTPIPAVLLARQVLATQLHVDLNQVTVVQVQAVDWPDGCLGVHNPGIMCNQLVTPGYKILLEASGKPYEYHSNRDGSAIVLAAAPKPESTSAVISWHSTATPCQQVDINMQGAAFGSCNESLVAVPFIDSGRNFELNYFVSTYESFNARTEAGLVDFAGKGQQPATPAVQRSIAEWAKSIFMESESGQSSRQQGLVLSWHREGGIAGFCDNLSIYVTGIAEASSCKGSQTQSVAQSFLDAGQLQQLYTWLDQYRTFSIKSPLPMAPDAMVVNFTFNGRGSQALNSPGAQQPILEFASQVYNQVRSNKPKTP